VGHDAEIYLLVLLQMIMDKIVTLVGNRVFDVYVYLLMRYVYISA